MAHDFFLKEATVAGAAGQIYGPIRRASPLEFRVHAQYTIASAGKDAQSGLRVEEEWMSELLSYAGVQDFLTALVPARPDELAVMEKYAAEQRFPIIGAAAGQLCYQIARLTGARTVFEMGSGFGYSTAWFARAVKENAALHGSTEGRVHHVVWDEVLSRQAEGHLGRLGLSSFVQFHVAEAVETLKEMPGGLDLIFNDINKEDYPASLPVIKEKLRSGGVLLVDNILWHGQVLDPNDHAVSTEGVREFTRLITRDRDWIVSVLPVRDGVMLAMKK